MRGHSYLFSRSLRIHYISRAARLCLLARFAPRPVPRAVGRGVMPPFRPSCRRAFRSSIVSRSACRLCLLLAFHRFPYRHGSLVSPLVPFFFSPPIAPPLVSRNGATQSSCLSSCGAEGAGACGFSSCLVLVFSACLARCRSYLKTLLGNLLKTCLGKLLKTFTGNLLKTVKHIPLPISFRLVYLRFASLCVVVCRLVVLSRLCFELIETVHFLTIAFRLTPRPVMPSCSPSAYFSISRCLPLIAIRLDSSPLLAHRAAAL